MHINKALGTMATIAPTSELFQIHHVVKVFQISNAMKAYSENCFLLVVLSAMNNRGTNAKKIKKVNGDTGHAADKRMPDKMARPKS